MKTTAEQRARWRKLVAELRRDKDARCYLGGMLCAALDDIEAENARVAELESRLIDLEAIEKRIAELEARLSELTYPEAP